MAGTVSIRFDTSKLSAKMKAVLDKLKNKEYLLRPVATELIPLMTRRIHINGQAADGSSIGSYATSYMKVRAKHGRTEPKNKVVIALTSKLENDWAVVPTRNGYGIGFLSAEKDAETGEPGSILKIQYAEAHFGKKIFSMSDSEAKFAKERLTELINEAFINP